MMLTVHMLELENGKVNRQAALRARIYQFLFISPWEVAALQ